MRIEFATPGNLPWLNAYCALIIKNGNTVSVQSRNGKDLTRMYPTVATAGPSTESKASDRRRRVAADPSARPSLQALQHRSLHPQHQIVFHAFDLRALDGQGLRRQPQATDAANVNGTRSRPTAHRKRLTGSRAPSWISSVACRPFSRRS